MTIVSGNAPLELPGNEEKAVKFNPPSEPLIDKALAFGGGKKHHAFQRKSKVKDSYKTGNPSNGGYSQG